MQFFDLDALRVLNAIPGNRMILLPDAPTFTIVAVTDDYLKTTYTQRETILEKGVFEAFFDNAQNQQGAQGINLKASLRQVLHDKRLHVMADLRYDLINPQTGQFDIKIWKIFNQPVLDSAGEVSYIIHSVDDITEIVQLREAGRLASQPQQTFLLALSDRLRPLIDPADIQYQAACALGEYTGASRVGYAEDGLDGQTIEVTRNYTQGVPGLEGRYRYEEYGAELMSRLKDGHTVIRPDIAQDPSLTDAEKLAHARLHLGATLNKPLLKDGQLVAVLFLHFEGPHAFTEHELSLLNETAERTWEAVIRARAEEALRAREAQLRAILDNARAAIGVYVGPDMLIENPNQVFIDILGKGPDIAGKPLREVLPELVTEGQPFLSILDEVYTTGVAYTTSGTLIKLFRNGELTNNYYNFSYTPVFDPAGKPYQIVVVAIDVTEQIQGRQALEEKEATLRGAIELAAMGTWELAMQSGVTTYSKRLKDLFEFSQDSIEQDRLYNPIHEADRARLVDAVSRAAHPDSDGLLDEEYTVITQRTRRHRIVRAQAKMFFDPQGQPTKLVGSMRDVTEERQTQLALEQLVQQRTEQLAATNEELAATNDELEAKNEEYAAINEELEEANRLLARSNDNLQQFAYVASHDLQEPLRKIQQFGDILKARQSSLLGEDIGYIDRMQSAASRMSRLIRDLLDFSRLATQRDRDSSVPLARVVEQVLVLLELVIEETAATITVAPLPTIQGDEGQLTQLFQNLLSNALKFRRSAVVPLIQISAQTLKAGELPATVKPVQAAPSYYRIEVSDNGVGFDEKYLDRIFELFQRLHGKNDFAGTGIGLAICERVVANHGGAITAASQPGQGAAFSVYLPV